MFAITEKPIPKPLAGLHGRHLLQVADLDPYQMHVVLDLASKLKSMQPADQLDLMRGRSLAMLFEKPSLRTRVSFEVAMTELGGHALYAQSGDFLVGNRESPEDAARTLSRYVDGIVVRTHGHLPLERFAKAASVPVINGLSDRHHPCQAFADLLTIRESLGSFAGKTIAFVGDANNNVATSLAQAALSVGMTVRFGCPPKCQPRSEVRVTAKKLGKAHKAFLRTLSTAERAVRGADVVYTDVWVSMGEESFGERKRSALVPYRVTQELISLAKPSAIFMHCLPAHRGEEVEADVIDGPHSVVFDQAENRLHVQKALILALLTEKEGSS